MQADEFKSHLSTSRWIVILSIVAIVLLTINLTDSPAPPNQTIVQSNSPYSATLPFRRDDS